MAPLKSVSRSRGEDAYPSPAHRFHQVPEDYHEIPGWGADLHPEDRPMVPMELPSDVRTARGDVRHWQMPTQRVFISNEMPNLTPVFGTSCPPSGLSGVIRALAFEYSEGTATHWMALMLADRVNFVESFVGAIAQGKPDNIVQEKGWPALWSYGDWKTRGKLALLVGGAAWLTMRYGRRTAIGHLLLPGTSPRWRPRMRAPMPLPPPRMSATARSAIKPSMLEPLARALEPLARSAATFPKNGRSRRGFFPATRQLAREALQRYASR